jgi:sugar phosphate isomerase/epimerase
MVDAIEIATGLGTDKIRVWAGTCGSLEASHEEWEIAVRGLREFADRANENGLTLVLEMHVGYLSDTAQGNLRLLEGVNRSNLRLNYQPLYTDGRGAVLEGVRQVAPYVATVHAQNYACVGSNDRSLISEGFVDYQSVVQVLGKEGFDGYLEVEFVREDNPEAALLADAKFLRSFCE